MQIMILNIFHVYTYVFFFSFIQNHVATCSGQREELRRRLKKEQEDVNIYIMSVGL